MHETRNSFFESPMMKVLHVSPMYDPAVGGGELHLKELCESLARRGHEVTVMTTNVTDSWDLWSGKYGGLPDREMAHGVKVLRFHPEGIGHQAITRTSQGSWGDSFSLESLFFIQLNPGPETQYTKGCSNNVMQW